MQILPPRHPGPPFPLLAALYGPTALWLALTALVSVYADVPPGFFTRDPVTTLDGHPLTGVQSHLGVLVWWAAAGICLFCAVLLRRRDRAHAAFLRWSGAITFILALDDLFLFHDDLLIRLGLPERVVFGAYGLAYLWYVVRVRAVILGSAYGLLALASVFLGSSLVVDALQNRWDSPWRIFAEDGFKLLGIVSRSAYLVQACYRAVQTCYGRSTRNASTGRRGGGFGTSAG